MVVCQVFSVAFQGVDPALVSVQVQIANGLPSFSIVGLADRAVTEARERVRGALAALNLSLPPKRITVSLSPADLPKTGNHFDLPIAMALLGALDLIDRTSLHRAIVLGELDLMARVCPVSGVVLAAMKAHQEGVVLFCPAENVDQIGWLDPPPDCVGVAGLSELMEDLSGSGPLPLVVPTKPDDSGKRQCAGDPWGGIRGQHTAKTAMEIAAAGGHHVLLCGPPGVGKTMLAHTLSRLLPALSDRDALEVSALYSLAGMVYEGLAQRRPPVRNPHHSASLVALVGGGPQGRPGETSLAHRGVLFLDEFPEFSPSVLNALRQPMESGEIAISRARSRVVYPARFQLVAAMNPCRCGYGPQSPLSCGREDCEDRYRTRISGPLQERIDLFVQVENVRLEELMDPVEASSPDHAIDDSERVYNRITRARKEQKQRYAGVDSLSDPVNATVPSEILEQTSALDPEAREVLVQANARMIVPLSGRSYHRVLRVARTIADLASESAIRASHVKQAFMFRQRPSRRHQRISR